MISSKKECYTLSDFGIEDYFKQVGTRGGKIPQWMLTKNNYASKQLWYNKKLYKCVESTTNTATIEVDGVLKRVNRKEILAPKNTVPVYKQKTTQELLNEIKSRYPDAKLHVPKVGCQLHGDIDATLTIKGVNYIIPWNY